jgi:hypothetical protein
MRAWTCEDVGARPTPWCVVQRNGLLERSITMNIEGLREAARVIRPYLLDLVGPVADEIDRHLAEQLTSGDDDASVTVALQAVLHQTTATRSFVNEVMADAPAYRPPDVQPGYTRSPGDGLLQPLAGDTGPVLHAGRYVCPVADDYVWYRPSTGSPVPSCPTHRCNLTRTTDGRDV